MINWSCNCVGPQNNKQQCPCLLELGKNNNTRQHQYSGKEKSAMKIEIKTMTDNYDCETCGGNWAEGGVVYVDGKEVLRREPRAYCYGVPSFSEHDLLVMALKKIGVEVTVDGTEFQVYSHDDEYHGYELDNG